VLWEREAPTLALKAARDALASWPHGSARDITHVVVHSCTGFAAPGLDFHLIQGLGLRSDTRKLGVNFMGCFGGFTTMFVAKQIIEADPTGTAVVLVVCVELCTGGSGRQSPRSVLDLLPVRHQHHCHVSAPAVHISKDPRVELIIGNTIFADGAAASIITHAGFTGAGKPKMTAAAAEAQWAIGDMSSDIIADSAHCMTWKMSPEVPGQYDMWLDK
jgi:predicted naringenin-chalcone synthase